jgi:uncharacterized membrane protein
MAATGNPMRRHTQFIAAALVGVVALAAAFFVAAPIAYSIGANVFFAAYSLLVLMQMSRLTPAYLRKNADATDQPVVVIFAVTLIVVAVAVGSLFQIINSKGSPHPLELVFALLSLPLGWFTIHAMAAMHYAHIYWKDDEKNAKREDSTEKPPIGGLDFPGAKRPEGWDFLYFAVVIGMTAQTADTGITTTQMRRIVLVHSIVSFFFNTVIVAAAVNLAVSLGS